MDKEEKIEFILNNPKLTNRELADALGYASERSMRRFRNTNCTPSKSKIPQNKDLEDKIKKRIKNCGRTVEELANAFAVEEEDIRNAVDNMRNNHLIVNNLDGNLRLGKNISPSVSHINNSMFVGEKEIVLGVISDTHIASVFDRIDDCELLYDRFVDAGVNTVMHCGNFIHGVTPTHGLSDIYIYDIQSQIEHFCKVYPKRDGIVTNIISGNCHEGTIVTRESIDIVKLFNNTAKGCGRDDLVCIGYIQADMVFVRDGGSSTIRLLHASGGSAQAVSGYAQKYADRLPEGDRPEIVLIGHIHKMLSMYHRGMFLHQAGCVCDIDTFSKKMMLYNDIGGTILRLKQGIDGSFNSISTEWIPLEKNVWNYRGHR